MTRTGNGAESEAPRASRSIASSGVPQPPRVAVRRVRPTRTGLSSVLIMALVGYGSLLVESNLLLLLTGMFVGIVFLSLRTVTGSLSGLTIERFVPDTTVCGQSTTVGYRLRNARRRKVLSIWIRETDVNTSRLSLPDTYVPSIEPQSELFIERTADALHRGPVYFGAVELCTRFPFGLIEARRRTVTPQSMLVLPALLPIRNSIFQPRDRRIGTGNRVERNRSGVDDFLGLREYRIGDNLRWIHWRRSASAGRLVVREMFPFASAQCAVVVDHRLAGSSPADADRRERVISAAASLACHALEQGLHVGLIGLAQHSVFMAAVGGKAHRTKVLTKLAALEGQPDDPLDQLAAGMQRRAFGGTQCALLTSMRDVEIERLASALRARGADVVILAPADEQFQRVFGPSTSRSFLPEAGLHPFAKVQSRTAASSAAGFGGGS